MTLVIAATTHAGVILVAANNPVFVTATGYLGNAGANHDALLAPAGTTWNITNSGLILGSYTGAYLDAGGIVANKASGVINGGTYGVEFHIGVGTVTNAGAISGAFSFGVELTDGGIVDNLNGGTISGGAHGVYLKTGAGTVTNAGAISATKFFGVLLNAGGVVANQYGGTIGGNYTGIYIRNAVGAVTNAGAVSGATKYGIVLLDGGNVNNQSAGAISGGIDGVDISGSAGAVTNAGAVSGATKYGIVLLNGGNVNNQSAGAISGGIDGVAIGGSAGTVTNAGTISAIGDVGVFFNNGGSVNNQSTGTIGGAGFGIYVAGSPGTLTNAGVIAGGRNYAVELADGGDVTNRGGGTISGGPDAIYMKSAAGTVTNAGVIAGGSSFGIELVAGGDVTNQSGGTISGGLHAIYLKSAAGTVTNAGLVSATTFFGVLLNSGGGVVNQGTGTIDGGWVGIDIRGAVGTVINAGLIAGTLKYGVNLGNGGGVSNQSTGTISGGNFGVFIGVSSGTVTNAGAISATKYSGVRLNAGGGIDNQSDGTISGTVGIALLGDAGTVTNAGAVTGTTQYGVFLDGVGGGISNLSTGTINGKTDGILASGGAATVTNAGTVSGTEAAITLTSGFTNRVVVDPGAVFFGVVNGGNAIGSTAASTLEFATGTTQGVVSSLGTQFTNFSQITIDAGASWTLVGANTLAAGTTLTNAGVLTLFDDSLTDAAGINNNNLIQVDAAAALTVGSLGGTGLVQIGAGGSLTVTGAIAVGQTVALGAGGVLDVDGTVTNAGVISGGAVGIGVSLSAGGGVINQSIGTISGAADGVYDGDVAPVTNAGQITGTSQFGVWLNNGGIVNNQSDGTISGGTNGLIIGDSAGTVTNAGAIAGTNDYGVVLSAGGGVDNQSTGTISGGTGGILITGSGETVTNAGTITGTSNYGVVLVEGGDVANQASGTIRGGMYGIAVQGSAGIVTNAGDVTDTGTSGAGVEFLAGGRVINQATGTITGTTDGILITGGAGTVTNAGSIGGTTAAVKFNPGFTDRVIIDPGAVFSGSVNGGNTIGATAASTLELAAGPTPGLMSGLGTQFINFAQTTIDAGALWTLTGADTLAAGTTLTNAGGLTILDGSLSDAGSVINNGVLEDDDSAMTLGSLTGTGQVLIGDASTLTLSGTVATGETIAFARNGLLEIAPAKFSGQIDGVGEGGRIELSGVTDATLAGFVNGNTVAIQQAAGPTLNLTFDPNESYAGVAVSIATVDGIEFLNVGAPSGPTVISQGATETVSGTVGTELAGSLGGAGGITVTGADSLLTTTTNVFTVGDIVPGSLTVDDGSTVTTAVGAIVANQSGASGSSASVSGAGSEWLITGSLIVGDAGFGSLSLSQGGSASAGSLTLGAAAGGDGVVSLADTGSALTLTGAATIGSAAAGELSILSGASVSAAGLTIGTANAASSGNVDVEGAGSTLFIDTGGFLNIGVVGGGSGELTIGKGTTLNFAGSISENGHASFNNNGGTVDPGAIEFTTASNAGNGVNLYTQYVGNIGAVQFSSGTGTWDTSMVLTGTSVADAQNNIDNNGDTGEWQLSQSGTMVLNTNTIDAGQAIVFEDATDTLVIGQLVTVGSEGLTIAPDAENVFQAGGFDAMIWGYQAGDQILFDNMFVASDTIVGGNTLEVFIPGDATPEFLTFFNKTGNRPLGLTGMEAAAAEILADNAPCFAAGTRIATERGEVAVEAIAVGDRVRVLLGGGESEGDAPLGDRWAEVIWVGRREVDCSGHKQPKKVWPVRVSAGAFGPGRPHSDVWLSPDHAVYVGEVLIPVKYLANGTTIAQVPRARVVYHHLELATHNVLLAEGLPAESFLDMKDGSNYSNRPGPVRLYPDFTVRMWEAFGCARLVVTGAELERARALVAEFARAREAA